MDSEKHIDYAATSPFSGNGIKGRLAKAKEARKAAKNAGGDDDDEQIEQIEQMTKSELGKFKGLDSAASYRERGRGRNDMSSEENYIKLIPTKPYDQKRQQYTS